MKRYIILNEQNTYYDSVTLYHADSKEKLAHFNDFYEATEFITSHGYSIVYLEDQPQNKTQRWGLRKWTS